MMVNQRGFDMGCGAACLASVLRISITRAIALLAAVPAAWGNPKTRGYRRKELLAALCRAGKSYELTRGGLAKRESFPPGTIFFCRGAKVWSARADRAIDVGHYVVWRGRNSSTPWMDPLLPAPQATLRKGLRPVSALVSVKRRLARVNCSGLLGLEHCLYRRPELGQR